MKVCTSSCKSIYYFAIPPFLQGVYNGVLRASLLHFYTLKSDRLGWEISNWPKIAKKKIGGGGEADNPDLSIFAWMIWPGFNTVEFFSSGAFPLPCGTSMWHFHILLIFPPTFSVIIRKLTLLRSFVEDHRKTALAIMKAVKSGLFQSCPCGRHFLCSNPWSSPPSEYISTSINP